MRVASDNCYMMLCMFSFVIGVRLCMVGALPEHISNDEPAVESTTDARSLNATLSSCLWLPPPITNQSMVNVSQYPPLIYNVTCAGLGLRFVPRFPSTTDILLFNLSENVLTQLTGSPFRELTNLQTLDLSHNQIRTIGPAALRALKALTHLYLDHNELHQLNPDILLYLNGLRYLDLSHNFLSGLPVGLFRRTPELSSLVLRHNMILSLPLMPLKELNSFDISHNPNVTIIPQHMSLFLKLNDLNLAHTRLSDPERVCGFLSLELFPRLSQLNLSSNRLTFLNKVHLDILHGKVGMLDLSGNPFLCDCSVLEIFLWMKHHSKPVAQSNDINNWILPKCQRPGFLNRTYVRDLRIDHLKHSCYFVTECGDNSKIQLCKNINSLGRSLYTVLPEMYSSTKIPRIEYSSIKLTYDPMLGWWTAASLGGMLAIIVLCLLLELAKKKFVEYRWRRRRRNCRKAWEAARTRSGTQNELVFPLQYLTPVYYSNEIKLDNVTKATKNHKIRHVAP